MNIKLKPNDLTVALLGEMRQALEAIAAGHYSDAVSILESRCRPPDPMTSIRLDVDSLDAYRWAKAILQIAPAGLIREGHASSFQIMVLTIAHALASPERAAVPETLLTAGLLASDFGLSLVWDFEVTDEANQGN